MEDYLKNTEYGEKKLSEIDLALTEAFEQAAGKAFRSLHEAHPGEKFYTADFYFNQERHPWVTAFSEEALERALREQEITDPAQQEWFRTGGHSALCVAYGYMVRLTELDELMDSRKKWQHTFDKEARKAEWNLQSASALEAMYRLQNKSILKLNGMICSVGVSEQDENEIPVPRKLTLAEGLDMNALSAMLNTAFEGGEVHWKAAPGDKHKPQWRIVSKKKLEAEEEQRRQRINEMRRMSTMKANIEDAMLAVIAEDIENAFRAISGAHPDETYYMASLVFNNEHMLRFQVLSEELLERVFEEQEITDNKIKNWCRNGNGADAVAKSYDYAVELTKTNAMFTERNQDPATSGDASWEHEMRMYAASKALEQVAGTGMFGNNCMTMVKFSPVESSIIPPAWF